MPATDPARDVWNETLLQNPHEVSDKRTRVQKMFAAIAPSYDLNNRLHSLWMDQRWRRKAVKLAAPKPDDTIVDVACGTGDLSLAFLSINDSLGVHGEREGQVLGIDFSYAMLPIARDKANRAIDRDKASQAIGPHSIQFINADALALPLGEQY